jgi:hypothetical protein
LQVAAQTVSLVAVNYGGVLWRHRLKGHTRASTFLDPRQLCRLQRHKTNIWKDF